MLVSLCLNNNSAFVLQYYFLKIKYTIGTKTPSTRDRSTCTFYMLSTDIHASTLAKICNISK